MSPKIEFVKNGLIIEDKILVISDLHIGYDEYLGIGNFEVVEQILKDLKDIFNNKKINKTIILGDLKHEFGKISDKEWRDTLKVLDFIKSNCKSIILIKGNHDNILLPIVKRREIKIKDFYQWKDFCFLHGDNIWEKCFLSKILILGHLHPSIKLSDEYKSERYKCFLKGMWKRKKIYVLPSFNEISFGYDLKK
jgi:putative SbcD/Mre11-related phosphoesterase